MSTDDRALVLGAQGVAAADVVAVARQGRRVTLGDDARGALARGAAVVDRLVDQPEPVYGVSTGFGALANTVIPTERSAELQTALIRSHAAGLGPEIEREAIRAMVLLRARSLAMGFSGARAEVVDDDARPAQRRHHARWSASTARSAPAATSPRWPRPGSCCSARVRPASPTAPSSTAPTRWPRPASGHSACGPRRASP